MTHELCITQANRKKKELTQVALQMPLQMPPQQTFHSDKFLIYFKMAFEFLEHLLYAIIFPLDVI